AVNEAFGEQRDIESVLTSVQIDCFLLRREQIKKQCCQSGIVQRVRDELIARTVTAATAAVREENEPGRILWNSQIPRENCTPGLNLYFIHLFVLLLPFLITRFKRCDDASHSESTSCKI